MCSHQQCQQKSVNKIVFFSESIDLKKIKQKQKKKIHTQVGQCYARHSCKISGKNSKLYFSWSSSKFSFIKQKTSFLVNNKSLPKIIHQYFSVQNQYNQTVTTFKYLRYFKSNNQIFKIFTYLNKTIQTLTLQCPMSTKRSHILNKPAAESCRFV